MKKLCMLLSVVFAVTFIINASSELNSSAKAEVTKQQKSIALSKGENLLAENNRFSLSIFDSNLKVSLRDKRTGRVYSTNIDENQTDSVATGENIDLLKSQIYLKYYDKKGNLKTITSYSDCVVKKQYSVYRLENGIAIEYSFGDKTKGIESIPQKINDSRFKNKILNKLDANDKKSMESYYKYYSSEKTWMVTSRGRTNLDVILKLLETAGYTEDDLIKDKLEYGYAADSALKPSFTVTVQFELTEKGLLVTIPTDKIGMTKDFLINEIGLLENFCTVQGVQQDSYIFVPDGSGALIDISNPKNNKTSVSLSVYGVDKTIKASKSVFNINPVALPVFGIKDSTSGMLAVIEEGEANAIINAYKAGYRNNQNSVFTSFKVMNMDYIYIAGTSLFSGIPTFQSKQYNGNLKVLYMPLEEEKDYVGMAKTYRNYLNETGGLSYSSKTGNIPLFLETVGGVTGYKSFLGISYTGIKKATGFEENIEILNDLKKGGVGNINLKLTGWFNNGVRHDYPSKVKITDVLGGKNGLSKLNKYANKNDVKLYPDVDFINAYSQTNGFNATFSAAKTLDRSNAHITDVSYVTGGERRSNGLKNNKKYIIAPEKYNSLVSGFLKSYKKLKIDGISLRSSANELYSDFKTENNIDRATTQGLITGTLDKISGLTGNIMVNYGSAYSLKYDSCIVNMPLSYSWFNFTDESIPFYQIVIHGSIDYAGSPLNLTTDTRLELLKCIEYGASPFYQVIKGKSSLLNNSEMYTNFSANFDIWKDNIVETYKTVNDALKDVQGKRMTDHEKVSEKVYKTTYENGISVFVNYGENTETIGNITIEPKWYKTVREG